MPKIPALTPLVGYAAVDLVDASRPPSHDELTRLFKSANLMSGDPGVEGFGKVKRMRSVVDYALGRDRANGGRLVYRLIQLVRAKGGFREESENFVGTETYVRLRDAYRDGSFELTPEGELIPRLLDGVPAADQDEVLRTYVRRVRQGATDAALVTGTGKDLLEATARRTLERNGRDYPGHDFPGTLFNAFDAAGLPTPSKKVIDTANNEFSTDPQESVKEALYILALQVNRLRNKEGTGHGRAFSSKVSDLDAKLAVQAMGLISELLLATDWRGQSMSAIW